MDLRVGTALLEVDQRLQASLAEAMEAAKKLVAEAEEPHWGVTEELRQRVTQGEERALEAERRLQDEDTALRKEAKALAKQLEELKFETERKIGIVLLEVDQKMATLAEEAAQG